MTFRSHALLASLLAAFALLFTSCGPSAPIVAGNWDITRKVVESNCEDFPVGTIVTEDVLFEEEGNNVTATGGDGSVTTGTRNGDTVTLIRSDTTANGRTFEVETSLEFKVNSFAGQSIYTFENDCVVTWDISGTRSATRVIGVH